ncbi:MAG: hypothetical protein PUP91_26440 [Rhizonema sp. PD37]|nr:hypothetical protein [Rhizonema sp. PD37]
MCSSKVKLIVLGKASRLNEREPNPGEAALREGNPPAGDCVSVSGSDSAAIFSQRETLRERRRSVGTSVTR